jgi:phage-related protein
MASYECLYFSSGSGESPVKEFIDSLDTSTGSNFFGKIKLLEQFGPLLSWPHAEYVRKGIHQLRFDGVEGPIRVFYFFHGGNEIVFTNGFIKKTSKTPIQELEVAWQRKKSYLDMRRSARRYR